MPFLQTGYVELRDGGWKSAISIVECSIVNDKRASRRTDIRECVGVFLFALSHYIMSQYIQCSLFTDNPRLWLTRWSFIELSSLHLKSFLFFFAFPYVAHVFHVSLPLVSLIKYSQALLAELFASSSSKSLSTRSRRGGSTQRMLQHSSPPPPFKGITKHYIEKLSGLPSAACKSVIVWRLG